MISNSLTNRLMSLHVKQEKFVKHLDSIMTNFFKHTEGSPAIKKIDSNKFSFFKNEVELYLLWDENWILNNEVTVNIKIIPANELGKEKPQTKNAQFTIDILSNVKTKQGIFSLDEGELAEYLILSICETLGISL
jgi:hypothetical protein